MVFKDSGSRYLHVVNANNAWVRSLSAAMPEPWVVCQHRIYAPQWLPGGARDLLKCLRPRQIGPRIFERWAVVPGWNKFPRVSTAIVRGILSQTGRSRHDGTAILYTFPFYSRVAKAFASARNGVLQAYWAHDAFAFYGFPKGFIASHERELVPLCTLHFAMTPLLVEDYHDKFPDQPFGLLRDAVSKEFLTKATRKPCAVMAKIRERGHPVVGSIGQINNSYDWDMIEAASTAHSATQFVFIGNLVEEGAVTERIRAVLAKDNVHWLGRVPHGELPSHLAGFDICLNPLRLNEHNQRRDPLRIYDYLTTEAPIYSLDLDGSKHHGEHVAWFGTQEELVRALGQRPQKLDSAAIESRRSYISQNTWEARAQQLASALDEEIR
jgi:glycosyltransferase involved in cell wall biosynthesis